MSPGHVVRQGRLTISLDRLPVPEVLDDSSHALADIHGVHSVALPQLGLWGEKTVTPVPFVVDTGCGYTQLSYWQAMRLDLELPLKAPVYRVRLRTAAGPVVVPVRFGTIRVWWHEYERAGTTAFVWPAMFVDRKEPDPKKQVPPLLGLNSVCGQCKWTVADGTGPYAGDLTMVLEDVRKAELPARGSPAGPAAG